MRKTTVLWRTLVCGLGLLATTHATAYTVSDRVLSWSCPTSRVDGSPFNCVFHAAGYNLEVTFPAATNKPAEIRSLPADTTQTIVNDDPPGTYYRIQVVDRAGTPSGWSVRVKKPTYPRRVTEFQMN